MWSYDDYVNRRKEPEKTIEFDTDKNEIVQWTCARMQGWGRRQEDHYLVENNFRDDQSLFLLLDGHGNGEHADSAAIFVKKHYLRLLQKTEAYAKNREWPEGMKTVNKMMDDYMRTEEGLQEYYELGGGDIGVKPPWAELIEESKNQNERNMRKYRPNTGTTCIALLVAGKKVIVANCGDGGAIASENTMCKVLSQKHDSDDKHEATRVEEAQGFILDGVLGYRNTRTLRALGDMNYKCKEQEKEERCMIRSCPSIDGFKYDKKKHKFVVLGTKGLWEKYTHEHVHDVFMDAYYDDNDCDMKEVITKLFHDALCEDNELDAKHDPKPGQMNFSCIYVKFHGEFL